MFGRVILARRVSSEDPWNFLIVHTTYSRAHVQSNSNTRCSSTIMPATAPVIIPKAFPLTYDSSRQAALEMQKRCTRRLAPVLR